MARMSQPQAGVTRPPAIVPDAYRLLSGWCYLERSLLKLWAGWGRSAGDWEDKVAVCRHTWLQSEITDRMRKRLDMFPGGKADQPVIAAFQDLADTVLLAPSFGDALRGIALLNGALVTAYKWHIQSTHPVHDWPTVDILRETLAFKAEIAAWFGGFIKRYPKEIDPAYARKIESALATVGNLMLPIAAVNTGVTGPANIRIAKGCGEGSDFRMPITPGRVKDWDNAPNIMPFLIADWSRSVETRRLFFAIGYMWEMGVAEDQLRWLFHADFMPWDFIRNEARHMWDECRHGMSGFARLNDFGLDISQIGYSSYGKTGEGWLDPLSPRDLFESFFHITQIAETGYFHTKRYCFEDFRDGHDDASAEMMQFDIIDETSHVEYGRIWMPELAERAGVQCDYRNRGVKERAAAQAESNRKSIRLQMILDGKIAPKFPAVSSAAGQVYNPALAGGEGALVDSHCKAHYHSLLNILRDRKPLKNASGAPIRPNLPM